MAQPGVPKLYTFTGDPTLPGVSQKTGTPVQLGGNPYTANLWQQAHPAIIEPQEQDIDAAMSVMGNFNAANVPSPKQFDANNPTGFLGNTVPYPRLWKSNPITAGQVFDENAVMDVQGALNAANDSLPPQFDANNPTGFLNNTIPYPSMFQPQPPTDADVDTIMDIQGDLNAATETPSNNTTETPTNGAETATPSNGKIAANDYFNFIKGIDYGAFFNNALQAPPPNVQVPLTHFTRLSLDRAPLQTVLTQQEEGAARSFREMRENASQSADIVRGAAAVGANLTEAQRQVGAQMQELGNQEMQANVQLANQEQQIQDQQNLQEQQMNYEIQAQAQRAKNEAMTKNLESLKTDYMHEAQYNETKGTYDEQRALDELTTQKQDDLNILTAEYASTLEFENSEDYLAGKNQAIAEHQRAVHKDIVSAHEDLKGYENIDAAAAELAQMPQYQTRYEQLKGTASGLSKAIEQSKAALPTITDETERATAQQAITEAEANYQKMATEGMDLETRMGRTAKYKKLLEENFNQSDAATQYRNKYIADNKIMTHDEYKKRLEEIRLRRLKP